jgi:hypothetical protein
MGGYPNQAHRALDRRWEWIYGGGNTDIIAYRITEDHEPKEQPMTREEIVARIEELQKQLDAMPAPTRMYYNGIFAYSYKETTSTHYFDIEKINGIPHVSGVAMKEVMK